MDNQNLKAFIAVASTGSFSGAADHLYLTQSAISKRIAQLEELIGKRLFDRIARKVSLTEAGRELLPRAKRILKEYENAMQAINDLSGEASGTLRLAISHHLGLHRLPPILKEFSQRYPNVTLDIEFMDSEKAYEQVLQGQSEVGVITLALDSHHNINSHIIWNDPLRFICAQDHPLAGLSQPSLQNLAAYPIILPGLNTYTGRIIQALFRDNQHYGRDRPRMERVAKDSGTKPSCNTLCRRHYRERVRLYPPYETQPIECCDSVFTVDRGWSNRSESSGQETLTVKPVRIAKMVILYRLILRTDYQRPCKILGLPLESRHGH